LVGEYFVGGKTMTTWEYLASQCDKCEYYTKCDLLEGFLWRWRNSKEMQEYIISGCDLAKACAKSKQKKEK